MTTLKMIIKVKKKQKPKTYKHPVMQLTRERTKRDVVWLEPCFLGCLGAMKEELGVEIQTAFLLWLHITAHLTLPFGTK